LFRILLHKQSPAFAVHGFGARRAKRCFGQFRLVLVRALGAARSAIQGRSQTPLVAKLARPALAKQPSARVWREQPSLEPSPARTSLCVRSEQRDLPFKADRKRRSLLSSRVLRSPSNPALDILSRAFVRAADAVQGIG